MRRIRRPLPIILLSLTILAAAILLRPMDPAVLDARPASWRIVDRDGVLLREAVGDDGVRAIWAPREEISPLVIDATLAIEDSRFSQHRGVDLKAVARATVQNLRAGRVISGASTLTMQLARLLGDHPHSFRGKLAQAVDAVRLERTADKDVLLEHYLNRAPYGAGTVGVEAASQRYFGKPSRHLSLAEAALIAGLPQAPSGHNPYRHRDSAERRQARVLARMLETDRITPQQYAQARQEPLIFQPENVARPDAMHFTDWVLSRDPPAGTVHTTLDRDLQRPIARMVRDHVDRHRAGGMTQAAAVVLDNETCDVVAMIGSVDFWAPPDGSVNGARSLRQPGSTLKPFTYARAFEGQYAPVSVVADIETRYLDAEGLLMHPRNYSERFSGPVLMREALGRSLNVPAVRVANAVGISAILQTLRDVGFSTFEDGVEHYGLGLTLGNGEVTALELAQAYATFARGGQTCAARILESEPKVDGERVFSEATSFLITDILSDEGLRARAFGPTNPLMFGYPVAVKTGTSTNFRDSWTAGYTDQHTVVVWAGDFSGRPMHRISGAVGAGPLFHQIVTLLTQRGATARPPAPQTPPDDVVAVEVCSLSGHAPGPHCLHHQTALVHRDDADLSTCSWHQAVRVDRRNGLRASNRCPVEHTTLRVFEVLPAAYARWQEGHARPAPPTRWSPHCPAEGVTADAVVLTHPHAGDVFLLEPGYDPSTQSVQFRAEVDPPVPAVTFLVDGAPVAQAGWPYEANWTMDAGEHAVEVIAGDRRSPPIHITVLGSQ